jgi:hypothetical protein
MSLASLHNCVLSDGFREIVVDLGVVERMFLRPFFDDEIAIALKFFSAFLRFFRHRVDGRFVEFCFRFPNLAESVELLSEILSCEKGLQLTLALDLASFLRELKWEGSVPLFSVLSRLAVRSDVEFPLFDSSEFFADFAESFPNLDDRGKCEALNLAYLLHPAHSHELINSGFVAIVLRVIEDCSCAVCVAACDYLGLALGSVAELIGKEEVEVLAKLTKMKDANLTLRVIEMLMDLLARNQEHFLGVFEESDVLEVLQEIVVGENEIVAQHAAVLADAIGGLDGQ